MYLHKIFIESEALRKDRKIYHDAYLLHQKMWELVTYDKNQKRDFLYRVEYDEYQNIKYIYLLAPHQVLSQISMKIAVSPRYKPQLETGERLYFTLRANPVIKRRENGKPKEYGLIMDAKRQFKRNGKNYQEQFSLDELINEVGMKWIIRKGVQHGFSAKQLEVAICGDREYLIKAPAKHGYSIRTLDFSGVLIVENPGLFVDALYGGIGSAKAFGCGLMLVRRTLTNDE
jgi:CRISPR system Cascade subunit CasE